MRHQARMLLAVLAIVAAVTACSTVDSTVTPKLSATGVKPVMARVRATDSMMVLTDISYSDTATTVARLTPLAADTSVSAVIGPDGGTLSIDALGGSITFPKGALAANTRITMTALHGAAVAYDFQPHGTVFGKPVSIEQSLAQTSIAQSPAGINTAHGAYFDVSLDSAYVDAAHTKVHIKENQIGYANSAKSSIKFSVGHFSGYIIAMGFF